MSDGPDDAPRIPVSLAAACLVAVTLRLPVHLYALVSDDEAIYDAMAQVVTRGGVMYRDTVDHKPPGLTYTYALVRGLVEDIGGSFGAVMTGVHLVGVLAVVLTCVTLHAIAREVLPKRLATLPPLLYAFASAASVPPDSLAVNGELLMNLPTALAVLAALRATRSGVSLGARILLDVLAGAGTGVAALYKYQGAFVGLSFFFLLPPPSGDVATFQRAFVRRGVALAVGLALPFAATGLYFWHRGAWDDMVRWGIVFNLSYLKEGPDVATAFARFGAQLLGVVLPSILVFGGGFLTVRRLLPGKTRASGVTAGQAMLVAWTLESLYCVTLGRRFFGHYFLQLELPLSVLAAPVVADLWDGRPRLTAGLLVGPALVFFGIASLPGLTRPLVYAADPDFDAMGQVVRDKTRPGDTIWVWGNVPQIYFTAERAPGVRFTFCNYLTGLSPGTRSETDPTYDARKDIVPGAWDLVLHDLDANAPRLIVDTASAGMKSYGKYPIASFPPFASYVASHYRKDGNAIGATLYRRVEGPGAR